jgi:hypothetical protein
VYCDSGNVILIVKKSQRKRCDFVFITIRVLKDMLDRHLHRKCLKPGVDTTCFVDETGEKIPTDDSVIKLLIDTLKNNLLREGEVSYPFAPAVVKCRSYRPPNWAVTSPYDGAFRINLERING